MALGGTFCGCDHLFEPFDMVLWWDVVGPFKGPTVEVAPHDVPHVGTIKGLANKLVLSL